MNVEWSFLIKKVISAGLMPLSLGVLLAIIALIYLYRNKIKKAKRYLTLSLIWIFLISYAPFANLLLKPLESQYPKLENLPSNIEYILLLGGDRRHRTWEALRLYQQRPNIKVITSGFSLHDKISDAEKTAKILRESGIKKENILTQTKAKDTYEEALAIKRRVGEKPFILITSAYHMPRSMRLFRQEGLNPIAAPTNFNNPNEDSLFSILQSKQLEKTEHAWHEYLGLLWINIKNQ